MLKILSVCQLIYLLFQYSISGLHHHVCLTVFLQVKLGQLFPLGFVQYGCRAVICPDLFVDLVAIYTYT